MKHSELMNRILLSISNENSIKAMEIIQVYNEAYNRLDSEDKKLENFLTAWYKPVLDEMFIVANDVLNNGN